MKSDKPKGTINITACTKTDNGTLGTSDWVVKVTATITPGGGEQGVYDGMSGNYNPPTAYAYVEKTGPDEPPVGEMERSGAVGNVYTFEVMTGEDDPDYVVVKACFVTEDKSGNFVFDADPKC